MGLWKRRRQGMQAELAAKFEDDMATLLAPSRGRPPSEVFADVPDHLWLWLHTEGYRRSPELRELLPPLPDDEVQRHWTFRTGDDTLVEGFGIYLLVRGLYEQHVGSIRDARGVLDFGCGYGRVLRFLLKDVDGRRLTGADHDAALIDFCLATNPWCNFVRNEADPPLPFDDDQFEFLFVYSVFSHFSEDAHRRWLEELRRVIRPGGVLAISVRRRNYIESLRRLRERADEDDPRIILRMFTDTDQVLARYDAGEFCFSPYSDLLNPWWGEACIPRAYIEREWGRLFEVVEFVDGSPLDLDELRQAPRATSEQNFVLLRV